MRLFGLAILTALLIQISACAQQPSIPVIQLSHLEERYANGGDTTFVVNFWATWCGPCVKELPYFETVNTTYASKKVKVLLVTLDFTEHLETKVMPFVADRKLQSEVLILDEANPNEWIPAVSDLWSGAIPATLFINGQRNINVFHEGSFAEGELEQKLTELGI